MRQSRHGGPPGKLHCSAFPAGCTGAAPVRDGSEIQGEMQCEGNRVLSIQTNLSGDGWEQSVSGEGPNGTYQSQETAHRIGDC